MMNFAILVMIFMDNLIQLQFCTFQCIFYLIIKMLLQWGNDTELIELRDKVKTEKEFILNGEDKKYINKYLNY